MSKEAPPPYDVNGPPMGFQAPGSYPPGQYPPGQYPPGQYQPPPAVEQHTVIVNTAPLILGPNPVRASCPHCHANITTKLETEANTKTHLFALLLCIFGCWPCCCLPYCMDSCQSQKHFCPNCRAYLGSFSD